MNTNRQHYLNIEDTSFFELEVKKSRFLVHLTPIVDKEQALTWVANARKQFPDARHHCWAYVLGNPQNPNAQAMSDDGEPGGTAGLPILNAIQHKNIGDVCAVVVRYFGGTKLGAGGLIRAYGGSVSRALDACMTIEITPKIHIRFTGDFALEQTVRHWLKIHDGALLDIQYRENVWFEVAIDVGKKADYFAFLLAEGAVVEE